MTREQLESFLKQNYKPSYLWARQCCGFDSELAEEVLQTTLLKILEGKAVFSGKSNQKTWLFSVIRLTALEHMRSEKKHLRLETFAEMVTEPDQTEEKTENSFHEAMLLELPARQREVLLLVFYHGKSLEQVARILDISLGSVSTHYDRAKKKLKSMIINQRLSADGNNR